MDSLPKVIRKEICIHAKRDSLFNLSQTNKFYNSLMKDNNFWRDKMYHDFSSSTHEHKFNDVDWKKLYFENCDLLARRQQLDSDFDFSEAYKVMIRRYELSKLFTFENNYPVEEENGRVWKILLRKFYLGGIYHAIVLGIKHLYLLKVDSDINSKSFILRGKYLGESFIINSKMGQICTDIEDGFDILEELKVSSYFGTPEYTEIDELFSLLYDLPFKRILSDDKSIKEIYFYLQKTRLNREETYQEYIRYILDNKTEYVIFNQITNFMIIYEYHMIQDNRYDHMNYGYYLGVSYIIYKRKNDVNLYIKADCQNPESLIKLLQTRLIFCQKTICA
jgi:hypothetical protein